jgi:hypothetical protein
MEELFSSIISQIVTVVEAKVQGAIELAPYILGALAMFLFGWLLAILAARGIIVMSKRLRLEYLSDKLGLKHFLQRTNVKMSPSQAIAKGVKGYLIFLFFIEATKIAKLTEVAAFLTQVINYVPDLIIALFILLVGIRIGNTVEAIIKTSLNFAKDTTGNALGIAAKYTVIAFAGLAALSQLQIAEILIQALFIGFVAMLTIAGGLAFGLGGKDVVKDLLESLKNMELIEYMESREEKKSDQN